MQKEIECIDRYDAMERFGTGEIDILFRTLNSHSNKMTGWRSFRKVCREIASPIWPWDYNSSKIEWKYIALKMR